MLTVTVADQLGAVSTLKNRDEVERAVRDPRPLKPMVDEVVADFLVSLGGHTAGARQLAETSGQPASVINLVEERLRRTGAGRAPGPDRRADRGLALIDEWTGASGPPDVEPAVASGPQPDPPSPAA